MSKQMSWTVILVCTLLSTGFAIGTGKAEPKPNIILIMADDLGYGDLSCYGNKKFATPNLDRLASEGMRFTDFHSSGPVCSPTRAGLLTGRYQQRAGIPGVILAGFDENRHHGLHTKEITFAEQLRSAGYATAIFGKWHLGYARNFNPVHHGFDQFKGYVSGNVDYISHFDRLEVHDWWDGQEDSPETGYTTHLITRNAVNFIEQHRDRPFCLYVAHESPHTPFQGPGDPPIRGPEKVPEDSSPEFRDRAYREMIQEMDSGIGEIMDTLERQGLSSNTLVFFLSDNGAAYGSNGLLRGKKGQLWEGGHRVPAIAWWPGQIKAGTVCQSPAISLDLTPTMWEIAGVSTPAGHHLDGISLMPVLLSGKTPPEKRQFYWSYQEAGAMRDGDWKLLINAGGKKHTQLFNLSDDPSEQHNLEKQYPEQVKKMSAAFRDWLENVKSDATIQPVEPLKRTVAN